MAAAPPPLLITWVVTRDGEPLKPMSEYVDVISVDADGNPTAESLAALNARITKAARRKNGVVI